jgi:hypothetical protein
MSSNGTTPQRKVFGIDLMHPVDALLRKVEMTAKKALREDQLEHVDLGPMIGHFDDKGAPHVGLSKGATASIEDAALEIFRMDLRHGVFEKNMPYSEMKNEVNRRLCRRLYRILEQEVVLGEVEACGLRARQKLIERLTASTLDPIMARSYRTGEPEPLRTREGALDVLELIVSECDSSDARNTLARIAELEPSISKNLGILYKIVENHRPFEAEHRVRAAYYLSVPFLFQTKKAEQPMG